MSTPSVSSLSGFEILPPSAPNTAYKNKTNIYPELKHLLTRPLNIAGRLPHQTVQFSLGELFQHLQLQNVTLKGSMVDNLKTEQVPHDIDLQAHLEAPNIKLEQLNQILAFIHSRNEQKQKEPAQAAPKTWVSHHNHTNTPAWSRLMIHLGYPRKNCTQIDLCYSSQAQTAYDAVGSSKTIAIELGKQKAHVIDQWHPSIVAWVKETKLLWFNPNIENGLGRLSYRLSKPEQLYLLQPQLPQLFCEQANPETILNIYKRLLRNEYNKSQLSAAEKAALWQPIIQALRKTSTSNNNPHAGLIQDLKNWSKFTDLNRLVAALEDPDSQEIVFQRLSNAYKVGSNFQTEINALLSKHEALPLKKHLMPIIHRALGAHIVPSHILFNHLDSLQNIDTLPKHELKALLLGCLHHHIEVGDDICVTKAKHTLGWLQNNPLSTLIFQLDRLNRMQSSTSNKTRKKTHQPQLLKSIEKALQVNPSLEYIAPALPLLMQQKLNKDDCHQLIQMLFNVEGMASQNKHPTDIGLRLVNLFTHHAEVLNDDIFYAIPTDSVEKEKVLAFHREASQLFEGLKLSNIPMLFSQILTYQNKTFHLDLPSLKVEIEPQQGFITLKTGNNKRFISPFAIGAVTPSLKTSHNELSIHWHDDCKFFSKSMSDQNNALTEGAFWSPINPHLPPRLSGLIQLGRALCSTQNPDFCYDDHRIRADGSFHTPTLLKAKNILDALKSLSTGEISDQSIFGDTEITQHIVNGKPSHCTINHIGDGFVDNLTLKNKQAAHNQLSEFKNAWHFHVGQNMQVERLCHFTHDRSCDIKTTLPWNPKKRSFDGPCTLEGQGDQGTFLWKGEQNDFQWSAKGDLFVNGQATPALSFSPTHPEDTMPEILMALIGTWLTTNRWGNYPFKPLVWSSQTWPPEHYEGFISQFRNGTSQFTGYKTKTGKAIGILINYNTPDQIDLPLNQIDASMYTGSFLIQKRANQPEYIPPFNTTVDRVEMILSKALRLLPHGFVEQQRMRPESENQPTLVIPWMYFMGRGVSYSETTPATHHQDLSPTASYQLQGKNYKDASGINKDIHVMLNPEDGGPDCVFVHPHEQKTNYQLIYQDSHGVTQKLLLINNQYRMGEFHLPNQVKISGEIRAEKDQFQLTGKFKVSILDIKFSGHLKNGEHQPISGLKGDTTASEELLDILKEQHGQELFTLAELISLLSGLRLSYKHNIQPFLKERYLPKSSSQMKNIRFTFPQHNTEI